MAARNVDRASAVPCAVPGSAGPGGTLGGVVNTYFPGTGSVAAGAVSIPVGTSRGAATPIAAGDLLLVIQMQDAAIDSTNTSTYGDGAAGDPATGTTDANDSGTFEHVRATGPVAAGSVPVRGAGVASGLVNGYTEAAATATQGQRRFQVIRVPQYSSATLGSTLTASPWDGRSGGILGLDVTGPLALGGADVDVSALGFRGGGARQLTGAGGGSNTAYRSLATSAFHAQKGEGIAGTPRYVRNGTAAVTDTGVEGYPNGSSARGAPGTAGGGGTDGNPASNDQNSGGGGGANGGTGGQGGNSWSTNLARGGVGGSAFTSSVSRLALGGGGGAGSRNNSPSIPAASTGGNGGGIVMIRAGNLTGTGSIRSDGQTGVTPQNDAGGGGGAGGSIMVLSAGGGTAGLTVNARGAVGGDAEQAASGAHGPGGGGGGGAVILSGAPAAVSVAAGAAGDTNNGSGTFIVYGATGGTAGTSTTSATLPTVPGTSAGTECTPQLAVTKTTSTPVVVNSGSGGTATYTITVANAAGRGDATSVAISDALPTGFTYASTGTVTLTGGATRPSTTNPTAGAAAPAWGTFVIPGGGQVQITFSAAVAGSAGGTYQNPATATYTDPARTVAAGTTTAAYNPASSTGEDVLVRPPDADVGVTKTVSTANPGPGASVTFTVIATNNGPELAAGVSVTDLLPSGLTYVSSSPSVGTYTPGTGVWSVGTLANGASATLSIVATLTTLSPVVNTATVTTTSTDVNVVNNSASVSVNVLDANLAVTKTVSDATPALNGNVTFTVAVTNNGGDTAQAVSVADALPAGLTLVSATPSTGTYTAGAWTIGTLASGANATLSIAATVTVHTVVTNSATASSSTYDQMPGNNSASAAVDVPDANLVVTKTVNDATPEIAQNVTFTVTVANGGPDAAQAVSVADALPAGLTLVSATPSAGTYASGTWTVGNLSSGAVATLSIVATVTGTGTITNTAVATSPTYDPVAANNTANATVNGRQADLAVTKTVGDATPALNSNVTFTVTVTNGGPDTASGVAVADALPAGLTLVSATPSVGTYTGGTWTVGALANGASATLSIVATVTVHTAVTNTATVSATTYDPGPGNNTASASVNVPDADLSVAKTVSDATPTLNSNVTFTVTVTNNGPDAAVATTVADALPAGLTLVSATPSTGSYAAGVWAVGTVANGAAPTLSIVATVTDHRAITNTATGTTTTFDPNSADNSAATTVDPFDADIAVTKTVDDPTPSVGGTVAFLVTATNAGPDGAAGVQVQDSLPAGLTLLSATPSTGTYAPATGLWTIGSLAGAASATMTVIARVTVHTPVTNTATATASTFDPVPGNNGASVGVDGRDADLAISKGVDNAAPNVGDSVTFTVGVTNSGPDSATSVLVDDLLPAGLTFVGASPTTGTYTPGTGTWTIGTLPAGATAALAIVARVAVHTAVTNTATVSSATFDPTAADHTATATVDALDADLSVNKSVDVSAPQVGDTVVFTITAANAGPDGADGVTVTDLLPAGTTFVSATTSTGSYASSTGQWALGALANGAGATLQITARITVHTPITNVATVSATTFDPNNANDTANAGVDARNADLIVTKTVDDPAPALGGTVTFTVGVRNAGPDAADAVSVADVLPAGLTLVSATTATGAYAAGAWTVGPLADQAQASLEIVATVTDPAAVTNTATGTTGTFDPQPVNNSASTTVDVPEADLVVAKTVSDAAPALNDTVTFTVAVTNNGPDGAVGVAVADALPAGLTLIGATPSTGTYGGGTWTVGAVASGATATLQMQARVTAHTPVTNTATVSAATHDPDGANNVASASVDVPNADLRVTKSVDSATPALNTNVQFLITVTNAGPDQATGVDIADALPAGLTLVGATPSAGTYAGGTWTVGGLANGASATLRIDARVTSLGLITNTATATATTYDSSTGDNTASASVQAPAADLAITKTVDNASPSVGTNVTFAVTVANNGLDIATGVVVTDLLPAGLTFQSAVVSVGSYDVGTGAWTVGNLANGATETLGLRATVGVTTAVTNSATATSAVFDPVPANNTDTATVDVPNADLAVTKTVDDPTPTINGTVTYLVTVTNNGPDAAAGATVADPLPSGLTLLTATPSTGAYTAATGVWTVGTLASGATQTLAIVARVTTHTAVANTASVASTTLDTVSVNDADTADVDVADADLAITKSVDIAAPGLGSNVTFTVDVTNNGPDTATATLVTDMLPAGLALVSATPTAGAYAGATGTWAVGDLATGATETLTIVATVTVATPVTNTATATSSTYDPTTPDTASAIVDVQQADVAVTKTVDDATPAFGGNVTFTVTATNNGPDAAAAVTVADALPGGLAPVSATPSVGAFAAGTWTVGTLANGQTATLVVVATVNTSAAVTNTATASTSTLDTNSANDSAGVAIDAPDADLAVTKTVDDATPAASGSVTFTVTLASNGPDAAPAVHVDDTLPAGLTLTSATATAGTYAAGDWSLGGVANGATETLTIVASVDSSAPITNTATVTSGAFDVNPANDTDSASVDVPDADLAITKTVDDPTPAIDATVAFTVTVTNSGPDAAPGTRVADTLPAGLTLLSATPSAGTYATGVWTIGAMANGATETLTVTARVTSATLITNTATVTSRAADPVPGDDSASATVDVPQADVAVTKTVSDATPALNANVTFTITVTNNGPQPAAGVAVADTMPGGLSPVLATPSTGSYSGGVWTIGAMANGGTETLDVVATVTGAAAITNTATVSATSYDATAGNDSDAATVDVPEADLAITKTVDNTTPALNANVTFSLTVTNNGPSPAAAVAVTDTLPAGLTFVSASSPAYAGNTWTIGSLAGGAQTTLNIVAQVTSPAAITNTATVASATLDPDAGDNAASASVDVPRADLTLAKTVDDAAPNEGQNVTYTLTLTNNGPDAATAVEVTDVLPAGLTFVSAAPSAGTFAAGVWSLASVPSGATRSLDVVATATAQGTIVNGAEVTASATADPTSTPGDGIGDDAASVSVTVLPPAADLSLTVGAGAPSPTIGGTVTYTLTVTNNGPSATDGVEVVDLLPSGVTYSSSSATHGSYDPGSGTWTIGAIASGQTVTLSILVTADRSGVIRNTAEIGASTVPDPDSAPANGSGSEDDEAAVEIYVQGAAAATSADLDINKSASQQVANVGDTVSYAIVVTNHGPDAATNVQVLEQLPSALQFVSARASVGAYDVATFVWSIPSIPDGGSASLIVTTHVVAPGSVTNAVQVLAADQPDPDGAFNSVPGAPGGEQASATLSVGGPPPVPTRLAITKRGTKIVNAGGTVVFTIRIRNTGSVPATNVVVSDCVPTGLSLRYGVRAGALRKNGRIGWQVGTLRPGQTRGVRVVLRADRDTRGVRRCTAVASAANAPTVRTAAGVRVIAGVRSVTGPRVTG